MSMMRRRGLLAAAAFLASTVFLMGLWHTSTTRWSTKHIDADAIGSSWIEKGEKAEDKAIIIAKMSSENTDWVTNDLPT